MTSPLESIAVLQGLLEHAGFSAEHPRFQPLWTAFQQFVAIPVECADADALCQWGTYSSAPDAFEFTLTRQFSFAAEDQITGMQQLHCILTFSAEVGAGVEPGCSWASEFATSAAFCEDLETLEAFYAVSTADAARSFAVVLEDIAPQG